MTDNSLVYLIAWLHDGGVSTKHLDENRLITELVEALAEHRNIPIPWRKK